nr:hypothetical protein [Tanacetum cinerariifolium]
MPEDPYAYVVAAFQAQPEPDYVPGPEEPEQAPPSLDEDDDNEEEEHSALADSISPPPALCVTARISFRPQSPTLSFTKEDAERSERDIAEEEALTTLEGVNTRVTELAAVQ